MNASMVVPTENMRLGIAMRVAAMLCFAGMASLVKLGAETGLAAVDLILYRNLLGVVPILAFVAMIGRPDLLSTTRPLSHLLRGIIGLISMSATFLAVSMLPLNQSMAIGFSAPLFATVLSTIMLGETVGWHRRAAVGLGFAGVLMVAGVDPSRQPSLGALLALVGAGAAAFANVTIRSMADTENGTAIAFWFSITAAISSCILMPVFGSIPKVEHWFIIAFLSVSGAAGQMLLSESLRMAPVSVLAPFDYVQLLFVGILAWLLFGEVPTVAMMTGALIIVGSGLYLIRREARLRRTTTIAPGSINEI